MLLTSANRELLEFPCGQSYSYGKIGHVNKIDLMGSREAARALGISRSSLNRAVNAGDISPVARIPGKTGAYLFDPKVIAELAGDDVSGELHKDNPARYLASRGDAA